MSPEDFLNEFPIGTRPSIKRFWKKTWTPADVQMMRVLVTQIPILDALEVEMQEWLEANVGEEGKDWRWFKLNVEFASLDPVMHFRLRWGEWLQ
jgi:hypothetical protein